MQEDKRVEEKKGRLLAMLAKGVAQLHLDARRPGVLVPERFRMDMQLVLNISYRYNPPDLTVNTWGVRETLSFSGVPFMVALPWSAIFSIGSVETGEFFMYPDEMPVELAKGRVDRTAGSKVKKGKPDPVPPLQEPTSKALARAALRAVALPPEERAAPPRSGAAAETPTPSRSHLRVVK